MAPHVRDERLLPPTTDGNASNSAPEVYGAVFDFLNAFIIAPPLDAVLRSRQNRVPLPGGRNDFVLMQVLSETRRGTNVHTLDLEPAENTALLHVKKLVVCDMGLEVHSDTPERALQVASQIELWSNDPVGVDFFRPYAISVIGCSTPKEDSLIDETGQSVCRFRVVLRLEYWTEGTVRVPVFDRVRLSMENVNLHTPLSPSKAGHSAEQE